MLSSYPEPQGRRVARATAERAAQAAAAPGGLARFGNYPSLNPGYDVVFSGVYGSADVRPARPRTRAPGGFRSGTSRANRPLTALSSFTNRKHL